MGNGQVKIHLLPPLNEPGGEKALKEVLVDMDRRVNRIEKLLLVLTMVTVFFGGREYLVNALAGMVK